MSIRFSATLCRAVRSERHRCCCFLLLPKAASARLHSRGMVGIDGTLDGVPFTAVVQPDGRNGHWLKVGEALRRRAGVAVGDRVTLEIGPARREPEPRIPADLKAALQASAETVAIWSSLTTLARRDWVQWLDGARKEDTRQRRISRLCDVLASGKRRVCCFDRSGVYSGEFRAPVAKT